MLKIFSDPNTQAMTMKVVRQLLPAIGSMLATYGFMTDAKWQIASGMIVNVLSLVWMVINNTSAAMTESVNELPGVKAVVTTQNAAGRALADSVPSETVVVAGTVEAKELAK